MSCFAVIDVLSIYMRGDFPLYWDVLPRRDRKILMFFRGQIDVLLYKFENKNLTKKVAAQRKKNLKTSFQSVVATGKYCSHKSADDTFIAKEADGIICASKISIGVFYCFTINKNLTRTKFN